MKVQKWKLVESKDVFIHPRMHLLEDTVELPNGTTTDYLRIAPASSHSVAVIAINNKNQILLQQEYSYPTGEVLWQLPGGKQNANETTSDAANRELAEESGYSAQSVKEIGFFYTNNRRSDEKQFVMLASDLYENGLKEDDEEFIISTWIDISDLHRMVKNNEIHNMNLLAAFKLYLSYDGVAE